MIKKITPFFIFLLLISIPSFSQNTSVPDNNFEQALIDFGYDVAPLDNLVPTTNINNITDLDINGRNITDLSGIEDFTALTNLNCSNNQLSNINITNNLNLVNLFAENNMLTSLDINNNLQLEILWCFNNSLAILDISTNSNLRALACSNNNLTALNVSNNSNLRDLSFENNQVINIDLSNNLNLNLLECSGNLLTNLNLSQNPDLSILHCYNNQILNLDLSLNSDLINFDCSNNVLTSLDLSNNSRLTNINCSFNNLCSLNIRNGNNNDVTGLDFSSNPNLNCVIVDNPSGNHSTWQPLSFTNYVSSANACSSQILVDELENFTGTSYTLPSLLHGNYYTESGGNGTLLFPGEVINNSQTIYIYNSLNSCYSNESIFNITIFSGQFLIPKFFTPNNDSFHDTWKVIDNTGLFTSINIYDRFGKLIKSLLPDNFEWDGTFKGNLLNTNDYWYVANRRKGMPIKGHFTLKR